MPEKQAGWSPAQRDDYLTGQMHALMAMAQALLRTHPDPDAVWRAFEQQLLSVESRMLPSALTDAHLEGVRWMQGEFYLPGQNPANKP